MKRVEVPLLAGAVSLCLLALAGCHKNPVEAVHQRASERWDLLASHQAVKAYEYLSPGYRSTHTLDQYVAFVATASVRWKSAKIDSVQCEEEVCKVKLTVTSTIPGSALKRPEDYEFPGPVQEKWILSEGQWYLLPDSGIKPGIIAQQSEPAPTAPAKAAEGAVVPPPIEKPAGEEKAVASPTSTPADKPAQEKRP